jgi:long-chain acyl-CoA synthetase
MGDVLLRRAMDKLSCEFIQAYGMTETSGTVVQLPPADHEPEGPRAKLLQSVGRAVEWVQLRVVDPATQQDVPVGNVGEIWIQSDMLMSGYWRKPAETSETLQRRWLVTHRGCSLLRC